MKYKELTKIGKTLLKDGIAREIAFVVPGRNIPIRSWVNLIFFFD